MAIILVTGAPGSGKSYSAIQLCVLPALDLGRPVRANIPLVLDEVRQVWPMADVGTVDTSDPDCWDSIPGGALVVLDEAGSIWPSGSRADREHPKAVEFIAMHRHRTGAVGRDTLSTEVVLLSQGSTDLAAWVKTKVDKTYTIKKLDAVGADKRFRVDVYQGWQDTLRPRQKDHIRGYGGSYSDKVFRFYESHTQGPGELSGVSVSELRADRTATVWNSWTVRAGLAAVPVFGLVVWALVSWFQSAYAAPVAVVASGKRVDLQREVELVARAAVAVPSEQWRLSGWSSLRHGSYNIVLSGVAGTHRRVNAAECREVGYRELECVVDGQVVASHTGPKRAEREPLEKAVGAIPGLEVDSVGGVKTASNPVRGQR